MKKYNYICSCDGRALSNTLEAKDIEQAAKILEKRGYKIIQLVEAFEAKGSMLSKMPDKEFNLKDKKSFFGSIYTQYKSGLPIVEVFETIVMSSTRENVKNIASNIALQLKDGKSFDVALSRYIDTLGKENVFLLVAGEETGKLYETSYGILKNIEKEESIINDLISKSIYPIIVLILGVFALLIMNLFVFPQIKNAVKGIGTDQNVLFVLIKKIILVLIIMGIGFVGVKNLFKSKNFRDDFKRFIFSLGPVKKAYELFCYVIFFRLLAISYNAGCPLIKAVGLASATIKSPEIELKMAKIRKMVNEGTEIATAFRISCLFPDYVISQIVAAEQTGEYDDAFKSIALDYENELNIQTKVILNVFQASTLTVCGIIVVVTAISFFKTYYDALFSLF
ncbi:MAG: type II secretion system F family protein [Candidatus Gastranaerophilales bacterium]|nr:type II secretion system F family protein [Candidatus Gastranaerophilales bacterium]